METLAEEEFPEIYEQALKYFGEQAQACQAMEECGELIRVLNKAFNRKDDKYLLYVAEEIADLEIVLEQLKRIPEISDFYKINKMIKLNKLAETIGG
ncbi:hypothetical protein [Endozoicomonas sp. SESOKO3]|uniref:hypothetical protein n=1 Tax=Endozoicomonas sp. SESOKO3 TaxID=2828744 RepID=UPI0021475803|nr:hypothetical protein [Endozoicomonas sp. SESOKO3]